MTKKKMVGGSIFSISCLIFAIVPMVFSAIGPSGRGLDLPISSAWIRRWLANIYVPEAK
jgi:hypothetical protein